MLVEWKFIEAENVYILEKGVLGMHDYLTQVLVPLVITVDTGST